MTFSTLKTTVAALALTTGTAFAGDKMEDTDYTSSEGMDKSEVVKTEDGFDVAEPGTDIDATETDMETADAADSSTNQEVEVLENAEIGNSTMVPDSGVGFNTEVDDSTSESGTMTVADLVGLDVIGNDGEDVGEIEAIIKQGGTYTAVVGVGGFLGLGEHDVAVPLADFAISPEEVTLSNWTEEKLKAQPEMDADQYTALDDDEAIEVAS